MPLKRSASIDLLDIRLSPTTKIDSQHQRHRRIRSWTGRQLKLFAMDQPPEPPIVLDTRLAYRVGSPILPTLPLRTEYHVLFPRFFEVIGDVWKILMDFHVKS